MRIVVDTNIVFSAILNTNSKITQIILHPKSGLNFYSTEQLLLEINEHKSKLKKLSGYSDSDLNRVLHIITKRIKFIHPGLIPSTVFKSSEELASDIDVDDTEFIALTEHIKGKFWSGDKSLISGLKKKGWNKSITTEELFKSTSLKKSKKK